MFPCECVPDSHVGYIWSLLSWVCPAGPFSRLPLREGCGCGGQRRFKSSAEDAPLHAPASTSQVGGLTSHNNMNTRKIFNHN